MKGWGNYHFRRKKQQPDPQPKVERQPAILLAYRGKKAIVRFHNGQSYGIPSAALKKLGVKEGERFRLLIVRLAGAVQDIRVEKIPEARPPRPTQVMPKVVLRDGRKLTTRK